MLARFLICMPVALTGCSASVPPSDAHQLLGQSPEPRREATLGGPLIDVPARERVTIVDFWSTSCAPCRGLMPKIERIRESLSPRGLVVIGVARDDNPGMVQEMVRTLGIHYPIVIDDGSRVAGAYRVGPVLPQTFVVGRDGRIRFVRVGAHEGDDEKAIESAAIRALEGQ